MPNVQVKFKCIEVEMFGKSSMFPNGNIGHKWGLFPFGNMKEKNAISGCKCHIECITTIHIQKRILDKVELFVYAVIMLSA